MSSWNAMVSEFRKPPLSDLQDEYFNFQNFYVLPHICFLSLVELKHWLGEVMLFPSSMPMVAFQHSRHFQATFFFSPDPSSWLGSGVQTSLTHTSCVEVTGSISSGYSDGASACQKDGYSVFIRLCHLHITSSVCWRTMPSPHNPQCMLEDHAIST